LRYPFWYRKNYNKLIINIIKNNLKKRDEVRKKIEKISQSIFVELANKILSEKKQNPIADTTELESKIDQLIYQLYDLTEEEIKIVEGN